MEIARGLIEGYPGRGAGPISRFNAPPEVSPQLKFQLQSLMLDRFMSMQRELEWLQAELEQLVTAS